MPKRAFYRIVWVVSLFAIIGMTGLFLIQSPAAPAADSALVPFTTSDKFISLRHPANWLPKEASEHGVETDVVFMPNETTRCLVKTDLLGAIMADFAKSNINTGSLPGMPETSTASQKSPLEAAHEMQGKTMQDDIVRYPHYEEEKAVKVRVAGCEALFTQFTYRKSQGIKEVVMVGRRITAITGERRLAIVTNCRKDQAETLEPIFQKIIDSVQIGQGG